MTHYQKSLIKHTVYASMGIYQVHQLIKHYNNTMVYASNDKDRQQKEDQSLLLGIRLQELRSEYK